MKPYLKLASLGALLVSTSLVHAQEAPVDLGTLVLSGGLTPIEEGAFGRSSTVITEDALERSEQRYVADVLRSVPGVQVSRTGSFGGLTQVRIRGHEGNHTLVIIDGVEMNTVNGGEYDFGGLSIGDISQIEVLRGPQSSLYGSNAIGGVISITTNRERPLGLSGMSRLEYGSDESVAGLLSLSQGFDRGGMTFSYSRRVTGGFDVSGEGGEDDGDINTTYAFSGDYELAEGVTIGASVRQTERKSDFDRGNFQPPNREGLVTDADDIFAEVDELFASFYIQTESFDGRLDNTLTYSHAETDRKNFDSFPSDNTGLRTQLSYVGTFALDADTADAAAQTLTFSMQHQEEEFKDNDPDLVSTPSRLEKREREETGYILEYRGSFASGFDVQGSVRFDDNDEFEDTTTWAVGASYLLPNGSTRLKASAGTGVQNPTLFEQFGFANDFEGNPDLEPEQSIGFDIGVEQRFADDAGLFSITYFQEELTDEIGIGENPETGVNRPVNQQGTSDRKGVEIAGSYEFSRAFSASMSYTYLDATDPDGEIEIRRPEHEFYLQGTYVLPNDQTSLTASLQHVAGLQDLDSREGAEFGDRVALDDYTLVNLSARHEVNEFFAIHGGVTNLTDEDYEELHGYATAGREFSIGLTTTF